MRGDGSVARGCALACGFGFMRAVTSNAYITAFGAASGSSLGFVAKTEFSLLTNLISVAVAVLLVAISVRSSRRGRWDVVPGALVGSSAAVLVVGYAAGSLGAFARVPELAGEVAVALLYAVGMLVLTLAWFEAFAREPDLRFALRGMLCGYLVQAGAYFVLSLLGGWALFGACTALLAVSLALMRCVRRGVGPAGDGAAPAVGAHAGGAAPLSLGGAVRFLAGSLLCVFTLTAVVGLLHTSVIGNDFEYVVGAIPMTEALAVATVLLALVVFASRRVPSTSAVYRTLFPVMLVALSALPFVSGSLGGYAGMIMVVCYDLVGMAFVLFLLEVARGCSAPAVSLMGVYQAGTQLSLVAGLSLGIGLSRLGAGADASYATILILVCIYLLSMVLTVLLRRRGRGAGAEDALPGGGGLAADGQDALLIAAEAAVLETGEAVASDADMAALERRAQRAMRERVGERVERYASERGLTPREAQVMVQLARGRSAAAIAADLGIAENTAWAHIKRVYAKVGVHGKQELIDLVENEVISMDKEDSDARGGDAR